MLISCLLKWNIKAILIAGIPETSRTTLNFGNPNVLDRLFDVVAV